MTQIDIKVGRLQIKVAGFYIYVYNVNPLTANYSISLRINIQVYCNNSEGTQAYNYLI